MDDRELDVITGHINQQIRGIIRNQQIIAGIREQLQQRDAMQHARHISRAREGLCHCHVILRLSFWENVR